MYELSFKSKVYIKKTREVFQNFKTHKSGTKKNSDVAITILSIVHNLSINQSINQLGNKN